MKKLAILFLLTACTSSYGPHYDEGYSDASWNLGWHGDCEYFITDPKPLSDAKLVAALKENNCTYITDHYDFETRPLRQRVKYYQGYNDYVEGYVLGNEK